ncbi:conserved hypothetical protein [Tenacibaculum litopenaei]|uniref:hypothetical protein n=1 Tax=Tenacibaculum litopenaei TaxID=396016 RepID=UPI003893DE0F
MVKNLINNNFKDFLLYLNESLPDNIDYKDVSNLCLSIFFTVDFLPKKYQSLELNKEVLSIVFSEICKEKGIIAYPNSAVIYGASFHNSHDKGHWLEVLASVFKLNIEPNIKEAKKLLFPAN